MTIQTYLNFDGRCDEALAYYKKTLGAEVKLLMRFKDNPQPPQEGHAPDPAYAEKVMHSEFTVGDTTIMATDGYAKSDMKFEGFQLAYSMKSDADAKKAFDALADGGEVSQPLAETFFATSFGMLADRFGVRWMIMVPRPT
ncbi:MULTISPECIES: VOC family protein [Dyella]|uniref:VOC family protein n=2 Tax=Dyella TaxID=231454 RepID=A0A4R0YMU3_9GAMM|nr:MULTISPECIES: VOC family protein [Dyella]TBR37119.1 VOC family protein [Dyella terrae]TCI07791.1 VOC family protein [Dyella soli]